MKNYRKYSILNRTAGIAVLCGALALLPARLNADVQEIEMRDRAKISLTDAIRIAEEHVGGHAYDAGIDDDSFQPEYDVSVAKERITYEVRIDGVSGKVIGSREDRDD